ncbi:MAG: DUF1566 domain-containing protein [Nitrospina sp.]|nr:MAG: DUF1566 domain-containing protein [Nitrospina sp.]
MRSLNFLYWKIILIIFLVAGFQINLLMAENAVPRKPVQVSADKRFQDLGDGTVMDMKTRLMWMKQDTWQMQKRWVNWYTASEFVQKMNNKKFAGYTDWRLPSPEEASQLYDRRKRNTDKDGDKIFIDRIFPSGAGWSTWTSAEKGGKAIVVSFKDEGGQTYQDKIKGPDAFTRLVRSPIS